MIFRMHFNVYRVLDEIKVYRIGALRATTVIISDPYDQTTPVIKRILPLGCLPSRKLQGTLQS